MDLLNTFFQFVSLVLVGTILVLTAIRIWLRWTCGRCTSEKRLDGKTVIITGANTGLGREAARDLAARGQVRVIIAGRDVEKCIRTAEEIRLDTGNEQVVGAECDLSSIESVSKFAQRIHETESRLDILICNACASGSPYRHGSLKTSDGFEVQFQVNHLGHFLLINLLMDMLVNNNNNINNNNVGEIVEDFDKRIVVVSSSAHAAGRLDFGNMARFDKYIRNVYLTYSDTKLMNLLMVDALARRLSGSGVKVAALHPGTIYTNSIRYMPTRFLRWSHYLIALLYGKSVEEGAQTIIYLAVDDEIQNGGYYIDCALAKLHRRARDSNSADRLWDFSANLLREHIHTKSEHGAIDYKYLITNTRNL